MFEDDSIRYADLMGGDRTVGVIAKVIGISHYPVNKLAEG